MAKAIEALPGAIDCSALLRPCAPAAEEERAPSPSPVSPVIGEDGVLEDAPAEAPLLRGDGDEPSQREESPAKRPRVDEAMGGKAAQSDVGTECVPARLPARHLR
jgi:hypothetical protein